MGVLSREELQAVLKREDGSPSGKSVMIGRRIISRVEDLPSQEEIDRIHAAKGAYVTRLGEQAPHAMPEGEQANQPPDRVPSASGQADTMRSDAPPADDAGKGRRAGRQPQSQDEGQDEEQPQP